MAKYKLKKQDKHDYASVGQKIYRRFHALFYKMCGSKEKARKFYPSYKHRLQEAAKDTDGGEHYMTATPVYLAGFGHGLGGWRSGLLNAELFGVKYAYSEMVNPAWDEILGLGDGLPKAGELCGKGYKKVLLPYFDENKESERDLIRQIIRSYNGQKVVFYNEYEQGAPNPEKGDFMMRDLFWHSSRRQRDQLIFRPGEYNVALHIRRGDVNTRMKQGDMSMKERWLDLDYYTTIMKMIRKYAPFGKKLVFYVFSEGEEKDYEPLKESGEELRFCLYTPAESSFLQLIHADLLVCAPSSFSVQAGVFSRNMKIAPGGRWFKYPANGEWLEADSHGVLEEEDERKLAEWLRKE